MSKAERLTKLYEALVYFESAPESHYDSGFFRAYVGCRRAIRELNEESPRIG